MSNVIISSLGAIAITTFYGLAVLGFMNLVFKNSQKRRARQRLAKENEVTEAFKKT